MGRGPHVAKCPRMCRTAPALPRDYPAPTARLGDPALEVPGNVCSNPRWCEPVSLSCVTLGGYDALSFQILYILKCCNDYTSIKSLVFNNKTLNKVYVYKIVKKEYHCSPENY